MKSFASGLPRPAHLRKLLRLFPVLALALAIGACGSDDNPMGPTPDPEPDPETLPEPTEYVVEILISDIEVLGSCDGEGNPGDFEYTIEIWGRNANDTYILHEELTGNFSGDTGDRHGVSHFERFRVPAGKNYYVGFKATDQDPVGNEADFVGYEQNVNRTGGQAYYEHLLRIGGNGCGMVLDYSARELPVR